MPAISVGELHVRGPCGGDAWEVSLVGCGTCHVVCTRHSVPQLCRLNQGWPSKPEQPVELASLDGACQGTMTYDDLRLVVSQSRRLARCGRQATLGPSSVDRSIPPLPHPTRPKMTSPTAQRATVHGTLLAPLPVAPLAPLPVALLAPLPVAPLLGTASHRPQSALTQQESRCRRCLRAARAASPPRLDQARCHHCEAAGSQRV